MTTRYLFLPALLTALLVSGWMNTADGKALDLKELHGQVILLDFWGVW